MNKYSVIKNSITYKSDVVHLGNLEDNHEICTTWILNSHLTERQIEELTIDITTKCKNNGLFVKTDLPFHLKVSGSAANFSKFFKIELHKKQLADHVYHVPSHDLKIPFMWENKVIDVLGLNTEKIVHPYFKVLDHLPRGSTFNPLQLAKLYNFPTNLDGTGQKIGVMELGGGYRMSDFITYFSMLGIQGPPRVTDVYVDGATNNPSDPSGASIEVILDVEIIAAIAPKADIVVYFGVNSYQGFYNIINRAINDGCNIISISWGAPEIYWSTSMLNAYNNLFKTAADRNITILAASGDNGSSDGTSGLSTDFPSSAPYAMGCGGTKLVANAEVTAIVQETVWNVNSQNSATGGGISKTFAKPSYQNNVVYNLGNFRGVPDVSGVGDPNSGYIIYAEGRTMVVGGTSCVSPLLSALMARINQSIGHSVGFINPTIYSNPSAFRDITIGNNGAYIASSGWDACSGLGSPNGQLLLNLFSGTTVIPVPIAAFNANIVSGVKPLEVQFTDQSTNSPNVWLWNFGDNTNSSLQNPVKIYQNAGTYTVSLTATNNGGSNTLTKTNYITVNNPAVVAPVAAFSSNVVSGIKPLQVQFTDQSLNLPNVWLWNFGDNTNSSVQNPVKIYQNAGTYTVSLTATNNGGSNTLTKTNYITVTEPSTIKADFTGSPLTIKKGRYVYFTNRSTGLGLTYEWNFGNGATSVLRNPIYRYTVAGKYTVSLKIKKGNMTDIITKTYYITVTN